MSEKKGLKVLVVVLSVLLALTGLIDLVFGGIVAQFKPELVTADYKVDYVPELNGLISVLGVTLLFWGSVTLLSAKWVWQKKIGGTIVGVLSGLKLLVASVVTYIINGNISVIIFDGARGAIIIVLAVVLLRKLPIDTRLTNKGGESR